jgi:glycosyltransferase involved in cell wall biosynthesis
MAKLRIALLAPLKRPINPQTTVSRNRIVADLALGFVRKSHDVTIFGTSDSNLPGVKIIGVVDKGLVDLPPTENPFYTDTAYISHDIIKILALQDDFDIIHNHMYPEFLPLIGQKLFKKPIVTTVHSQITSELRMALSDTKGESRLVSISESAKKALNLESVVIYNGIDTNLYAPGDALQKNYLLFIGRMSKAKANGRFIDPKGVDNAIEAAKAAGENLKIVSNVEDKKFYDEIVAPNLSDKIKFVGDVSSEQKLTREEIVNLHQNAKAFLFPINWEEPFGLVMAEAMACGTPVIAYNRGSVSELVRDGVTGFVVEPED